MILSLSLLLVILSIDRFGIALQQSGSESSEVMELREALVASGLVLLGHVSVVARWLRNRPAWMAYLFLVFALFIFVTSLGVGGAMVAVVLAYGLALGILVISPTAAILIWIAWLILYTLLLQFAAPFPVNEIARNAANARGLAYLLGFVAFFQFQLSRTRILYRSATEAQQVLETSVEELTQANISYNTFVQMAEAQAARHERNRITREIHDGVGYALTNLIMLAESAQDSLKSQQDQGEGQLALIKNHARLALNDTRRALRDLRDSEQSLFYGQDAIDHMMEVFGHATGVRISAQYLIPRGLLSDRTIFPPVYRFVQEALTNSFRHGHARSVALVVKKPLNEIIVEITDDGKAPATVIEGIGLQGMRERLGEIGGELTYSSATGFTVIARIPYGEQSSID